MKLDKGAKVLICASIPMFMAILKDTTQFAIIGGALWIGACIVCTNKDER